MMVCEGWKALFGSRWEKAYLERRLSAGSAAGLGVESTTGSGAPAAPQNAATGGTNGGGLQLAWVGIPLIMLVLVVDRGVGIIDEIKQCTKQFIAHNNVALATAYRSVRGVGFVASIGLGVVTAVHACIKRLKVQPGRPRVTRPKRPKQQLDLAPASAGGVLQAAGTSTTGQVDAS
ncbi:hypothetical protein Vretifemale_14011 [Volvox reticuliferus]|uniref:Uncharacterized protein n=1 Tax=Volvox reticuliferus TaxID=1737510 RepID=A0A8J4FQ23_9CHLO|nr:hypothetical protein Vretifemale_14011 [Volvox reticuliferus]